MKHAKILKPIFKILGWTLLIFSFLIYNFISRNERDRYKEEAERYKAKYEESLIFIEEFKNACDSIVQRRDDSIKLLTPHQM